MKKQELTQEGITAVADYIISEFKTELKCRILNPKNISAIFLAGAPGAGKTEFLKTIFSELNETFIIIDVDIYRFYFKGYTGTNSSEYQRSSVRVADKILKHCFKNDLNFIFDGTFRNYNKVQQNFNQCKKYNRNSLITLVYQDPRISFYYTFLRKLKKKRNVPIDVFIDGFYGSIANIFQVKRDFSNIDIMIACKRYSFADKDKFSYDINHRMYNIVQFCKRYRILYKKGAFKNRQRLEIDIKDFNDTLVTQFKGSGGVWTKIKIWYIEKFFKL